MTDIAIGWHEQTGFDLALTAGELETDTGLVTAILCSLFSWREAEPGDPLPDGDPDPKGWQGDRFARINGDRIGSRLWLLRRAVISTDTLARARAYGSEALHWLVEDGAAAAVRFEVWRDLRDSVWTVRARVTVTRHAPEGPLSLDFDDLWKRIARDDDGL